MGASLVSPQAKSVFATPGRNFAPKAGLDALQQQRPNREPDDLTTALRNKYQEYMKRDEQAWREVLDIGKLVANLRNGKLLLMRHALDNRYLFVKRDGRYTDNKTVGGLFQFYSTKLQSEWLSSKPQRDPICPSDDDQIEEFIADVKIVQEYYDKKFFDTNYETRESLSAQDFGTWVTRYRFDPDDREIVCELLDFPACKWDMRYRAEDSSWFIYNSKCATSKLVHLLNADIQSDGEDAESYGLELVEMIARQGGNVAGYGKDSTTGNYNDTPGETTVTEMWLCPDEYCEIKLNGNEPTLSGKKLPQGSHLIDLFPNGLCAVGINGMQTIIGLYAEAHKDHIVSGIYHLQSYSGIGKGVSDAVDVKKEMDDLHSQTMAYLKAHGTPSWGYNQHMVSEQNARDIGKPRKIIPFDFTNAPDGVKSINEAVQALIPTSPSNAVWEMGQHLENYLQMAFQVTSFSDGMPGVDNKTATGARIGDQAAQSVLVPQLLNKADHRKRSDKVIYNLFKKYVDKPKFFATRDLNGITAGKNLSGSQFNDVDIDFQIVADSENPKNPLKTQLANSALLQASGGLPAFLQCVQMNPEMTGAIASSFGANDLPIPKKTDIARVCRKRIEQAKKLLQMELQMQGIMAKVTGQKPDNTNLAQSIVSQLMPPISAWEQFYSEKVSWLSALLDTDEMQFAPMELRYVIEEMIRRHFEMATLGKAEVEQNQNIGNVMSQLPMLLGQQATSQEMQKMQQDYEQAQAQQEQQNQMQQQAMQAAQQQQQQRGQLQLAQVNADTQRAQSQAQHQTALAQADTQHASSIQQMNLEHAQNLQENQQDQAHDLQKAQQSHTHNLQLETVRQKGALEQAKAVAKARPKPTGAKK